MNETSISINQLADEMRQGLYIKPIDEAIERLQQLKANYNAINDLIDSDSLITEEG